MRSSLFALIGGASTALAAIKGFNYGAQEATQAKFEADFKTAASLSGTNGAFKSARLYTMIQEKTANDPTQAIPAAIDSQTTLLLGLWASVDSATFQNELTALNRAISMYGSKFTDLVVGISVGSEDLYRITPTGIINKSGIGQDPNVLVSYITKTREAIKGGPLASKPVGHVDTWNAFVNGTNKVVNDACDFLGLDEYPYFQTTDPNAVSNGKNLFFAAFDAVQNFAPGKQIWVTEAGWPVSGPASGAAIASAENAEIFWQDVYCELDRRGINTWWYTLNDAGASPSFGVSQNGQPLYDLTCKAVTSSTSSSMLSTSSSMSYSSSSISSVAPVISSSSSSMSSTLTSTTTSPSSTSLPVDSNSSSTGARTTSTGSATITTSRTSSAVTTPSGSSTVVPNTSAAGKIEAGVTALFAVALAVLFL